MDATRVTELDKVLAVSNKIETEFDKNTIQSNKNAPESIRNVNGSLVNNNCWPLTGATINNDASDILTPRNKLNRGGILCASPLLKSVKRALRLSPSTPVGLSRKLQLCYRGQEIKPITFGEDVEMTDLDLPYKSPEPEPKPDEIKSDQTKGRRFVKGLRRKLDCNRLFGADDDNDVGSSTSQIDQLPGSTSGDQKSGNNMKGKTIKSLRLKQRENRKPNITIKAKLQRKKSKKEVLVDEKQRLIDHYYAAESPSTNKLLVGHDTEDTPKLQE